MDIFKDQREKYFPETTSFEIEHEKLTYRINCVQESINRLNEDIIILKKKRHMQFKRKSELLNELYKLINNKKSEDE